MKTYTTVKHRAECWIEDQTGNAVEVTHYSGDELDSDICMSFGSAAKWFGTGYSWNGLVFKHSRNYNKKKSQYSARTVIKIVR